MVEQQEAIQVEIDGRTFIVRSVSMHVLESGHMVAQGISRSLGKPFPWSVGFFFANPELELDLWPVISGIRGFDD